MRRGAEARIGRLEWQLPDDPEDEARSRRIIWRFTVALGGAIREIALRAGIDPSTIAALRLCAEAAAALAALGDTPALRQADIAADASALQAAGPDPEEASAGAELVAELARLGRRCAADSSSPGPGGSLIQWWAWALWQPARGDPAPAPEPAR